MSSSIAISVNGVSKCYAMFGKPQDRLIQMLTLGKKRMFNEHWALKNVSFEVPRGQTVGIVGRNGSGKSTLLQLIAGTLMPTAGFVAVSGRVTALLELGAGFNPEYSGRDNIFLSGAVLGMSSAEIENKFDSIAAFADIGDFMSQPAKTYSSGMYMRLAFAVASSLEPEIMIVDEALSVGDAKFQAKCFRRFEEFQENGGTVLLVTHSTEQVVRHCNSAVLLESGQVLEQGESRVVVNRYLDLLFGGKRLAPSISSVDCDAGDLAEDSDWPVLSSRLEDRPNYNKDEYRWGSGAAEILDCMIVSKGRSDVVKIEAGDSIDIYVKCRFSFACECAIFGFTVQTPDGVTVFGTNSRDWSAEGKSRSFGAEVEAFVRFTVDMNIAVGEYLLSVGIAEECQETGEVRPLDRRYDAMYLIVLGKPTHSGLARLPVSVEFLNAGGSA